MLLIHHLLSTLDHTKKGLVSLCCFFSFVANAQLTGQARIDSLLPTLKTAKEDTSKVNLLVDLSFTWSNINTDEGLKYGNQALALAKKLNWKKGIAYSTMRLGVNYNNRREDSMAIDSYKQARLLFEQLNDKAGLVKTIRNLGNAYYSKYDYKEALKIYSEALKLSEESGQKNVVRMLYDNIGLSYLGLSEGVRAKEFFEKAVKANGEANDKPAKLTSMMNILELVGDDSAYLNTCKRTYAFAEELNDTANMVITLVKMTNSVRWRDMPSAWAYLEKAIYLAERAGKQKSLVTALEFSMFLYSSSRDYVKVNNYLARALAINKESGTEEQRIIDYNYLGSISVDMVKDSSWSRQSKIFGSSKKEFLALGISYLDSAIELNKKVNNKGLLKDSYYGISDLQAAAGDYKGALENFRKYSNIYETILLGLLEKHEDFVQGDFQEKAEQEKKDALEKAAQEKKQAIQKNIRNAVAIGLAGALLFLVWIFRQRNKINKEKKRSEELLLNILPASVAEELKTKGSADAKQFDLVTVMFTDFKSFTPIAEKFSPEELISEINLLFKAFDEIITRHGIEKIKTIGDSYMCAGGLPVANQTHATDVVSAGKEIQEFMRNYSARRRQENKPYFDMRIGIHTGPVVAGIVGIKKFAYDIWGDAVNTASRMESSGEPGKVNISGTTYELVKEKFTCSYRGKIPAKNKGEIDMYFVD